MKVLKWLDDHFEEAMMTTILAVMVVVLTAQVICRKVLGNSLQWSEELCRYLFIWSGFLSLSYTIHNHSTMKTELFMDLFPKGVQKWVRLVTELGMLVLVALLVKVSVDVVPTITQRGTAIPISRKWIFAAPVAGFALSAVRLVQELWKELRGKASEEKPAEKEEV